MLAYWTLSFSFIYDVCLRDNDSIGEFTKWQFSLLFLSLVYFTHCNPIKGKANWSLASFLLSLAKKSITSSPELPRLLSTCISISTGFAGLKRINGNMFNSILICFIFSKMETTLWGYIMRKGSGAYGNCFCRKAECLPGPSCLLRGVCLVFWSLCLVLESCGQSSCWSIVPSTVSLQTLEHLAGHIKSNPTHWWAEKREFISE